MSFHEIRFSPKLSFASSGGLERRTEIVSLANGFEARNTPWEQARRRYDAGLGVRSLDDLDAVLRFFEARRGPLMGFRWKDWLDHKSCAPSEAPAPTDQLIAIGNGATTGFQLVKDYGGTPPLLRPIAKPVEGTVRVAVGGTELFAPDFVVDPTTGFVTFAAAPGAGQAVTAGYEFDVPVRFASDSLEVNLAAFEAGEIPSIPILEVRGLMRALPATLAAKLASGATTLARAWAVTRRDGATLGFTDHDRPLAFEGTTFEAAAGLTATALEASTGLAPDSHSIEGALSSAAITEADLEAGLYDGAEIRLWLVDWTAPTDRVLLSRGQIGEVRRGAAAFEAEVLGLAERLNQPRGRAYLPTCDARLGDTRCSVDLDNPAYRATGQVSAILGPETIEVTGLSAFASRWFDRGHLAWTSGANTAEPARIKGAPQRQRRPAHHPLAGARGPHRPGRCVHRHGRLRQAPRDLPREVRQPHEFPRFSLHARRRLGHHLPQFRRGP